MSKIDTSQMTDEQRDMYHQMQFAMIFRWKSLEACGMNSWDRPDLSIIPPMTPFPKMVRPEWWWHNWRTEIPLRLRTALYVLRRGVDDL